MPFSLFEALGSVLESVRGFVSGMFGRAVEEGIEWPQMQEALEAGGLEIPGIELSEDFDLQARQSVIASEISSLYSDRLIPEDLHVSTDRLLPHRYAYEVEIIQYDAEGNVTTSPFYVGSNTRLSRDEILDIADTEANESPPEGMIGYEVGNISAAWFCESY